MNLWVLGGVITSSPCPFHVLRFRLFLLLLSAFALYIYNFGEGSQIFFALYSSFQSLCCCIFVSVYPPSLHAAAALALPRAQASTGLPPPRLHVRGGLSLLLLSSPLPLPTPLVGGGDWW